MYLEIEIFIHSNLLSCFLKIPGYQVLVAQLIVFVKTNNTKRLLKVFISQFLHHFSMCIHVFTIYPVVRIVRITESRIIGSLLCHYFILSSSLHNDIRYGSSKSISISTSLEIYKSLSACDIWTG